MDLQELRRQVKRGRRFKYLFFWSHRGKGVGPFVLSNWFAAPFALEGHTYPSVEFWMMAEKARLFGDMAMRDQILAARSPSHAKALGRQVRGFTEARWRAHRVEIVERGLKAKFAEHDALCAYLRTTGSKVLVEASPHDRHWGIGLAAADPGAKDPRRWRGENLLGFALMRVRAQLDMGAPKHGP